MNKGIALGARSVLLGRVPPHPVLPPLHPGLPPRTPLRGPHLPSVIPEQKHYIIEERPTIDETIAWLRDNCFTNINLIKEHLQKMGYPEEEITRAFLTA